MSNILEENPNRFVLFPIQHHDIWNFYKKSQASFWTAEEIDLSDDLADYENLEEDINNLPFGDEERIFDVDEIIKSLKKQ